jgi:hypothetical protein
MKNIKQKFKKIVKYLNSLINRIQLTAINKAIIKYLNSLINRIQLTAINKAIIKYLNSLINKIQLIVINKSKKKFYKKSTSNISNFNIYLISIIALLFTYLFYLSIPALYNKSWVQNTLQTKLINEFKINFSISSEISYEILPYPHFKVKNIKILNDNTKNPKKLSEIKEIKIFITQTNFFIKNKFKVKGISINNANFLIQKSDFSYFDKLFNKKFSHKKIAIKNSNIFFKDINGETISITQISKLSLFYDNLKLLNNFFLNGEMFKIPFTYEFSNDLIKKKNITLLTSKKFKTKIINNRIIKNETVIGLNTLSIANIKLISKYKLKNNFLSFESSNSQILNNKIDYNGKLNFNPFNFILDIDLEKINLKKLFNTNSILFEILKSKHLFHKNLSITTSLNVPNVSNNKTFNSLRLNFKTINGEINFDNSFILSDKIGLLNITKSKLILDNDNSLLFNGNFNLKIKNSDRFFSFFQTKKKFRSPIKNISFNLGINISQNRVRINSLKIDNLKPSIGAIEILNNFNSNENQKIKNLITFRNLVNDIISAYDG